MTKTDLLIERRDSPRELMILNNPTRDNPYQWRIICNTRRRPSCMPLFDDDQFGIIMALMGPGDRRLANSFPRTLIAELVGEFEALIPPGQTVEGTWINHCDISLNGLLPGTYWNHHEH